LGERIEWALVCGSVPRAGVAPDRLSLDLARIRIRDVPADIGRDGDGLRGVVALFVAAGLAGRSTVDTIARTAG
jgi:hypothetical protein